MQVEMQKEARREKKPTGAHIGVCTIAHLHSFVICTKQSNLLQWLRRSNAMEKTQNANVYLYPE